MLLLFVSFMAGVLTIAAPCILPLLPVIVGGTLARDEAKSQKPWFHPLVITLSLSLSVVLFTLLLKSTTALLGVPQMVWQFVSGIIVILFGINLLFPVLWEKLMVITKLNISSNKVLGKSFSKKGVYGDILIGASLGPVFASCSPTYSLIVATVLPASYLQGLIYLFAYALGLALALFLVAILSKKLVDKLGWLSNPNGGFRKFIGVLFIAVGLIVIFGIDKNIQSYVLEQGWYDPISKLEKSLDN